MTIRVNLCKSVSYILQRYNFHLAALVESFRVDSDFDKAVSLYHGIDKAGLAEYRFRPQSAGFFKQAHTDKIDPPLGG